MQSGTDSDQTWRPLHWANAIYYLLGVGALVMGSVVVTVRPDTDWSWTNMMGQSVWVGGMVLILWKFLEIRWTHYRLSQEQLLATQGVLNRLTDNLELYPIKDTQVVEPIWLRSLGLGEVVIHSSDKTTPVLYIRAIPRPLEIATTIRRQSESERVRKGVREFD